MRRSRNQAVVFTRDLNLGSEPTRFDFLVVGGGIRVLIFPALGVAAKHQLARPAYDTAGASISASVP